MDKNPRYDIMTEKDQTFEEAGTVLSTVKRVLSVQSHFFTASGQLLHAYVSSLSEASMHRLFV